MSDVLSRVAGTGGPAADLVARLFPHTGERLGERRGRVPMGGGEVWARSAGTSLLLAIAVSAVLVVMINQTFTNVVVPDIRDDFGATQGWAG